MKTIALTVKASLFLFLAFALSGCWSQNDYSESPWGAYATKTSNGKQEWWMTSYKTKEECLEDVTWEVTNGVNTIWYTAPVGCGFYSNSRLQATLYFISNKTNEFECLSKSKNPAERRMKMKYGPWLKSYSMEESKRICVWPSLNEKR
jgi:hypothetical protein